MNAPCPNRPQGPRNRHAGRQYTLEGRAFMSGVQALVRLPMLQRQRDAAG
jgi:indolepyruvate ferredoxin oxidoreductase